MNDENLIRNEDLTPSERRERASRAGKASGEARRRRRNMREVARMVLDEVVSTQGAGEQEVRYIIAHKLALEASKGNHKAAKLLVDWSGEAPTRQELTGEDGTPLIPRTAEEARKLLDKE